MLYQPRPNLQGVHTNYISVFYHPSAGADDMLRSVLHAACLKRILRAPKPDAPSNECEEAEMDALYIALEKSTRWTHRNFDEFKCQIENSGWRTDEIAFADFGRRVLWGSAAQHIGP